MKNFIAGTCALLLLAACQTPTPPIIADTAITDVTVIDVETGQAKANQTVLIRDGTIISIASNGASLFSATETIVGSGKYLSPGLIDMHVHISRSDLLAFPLNGVTTIRDMGTQIGPLRADASILGAREDVEAGEIVGPEVFTPALILDGPIDRSPQWAPHYRAVETVDQANEIVDSLAALDVDFIKVYSGLEPDIYEAIRVRAAFHGLDIAGHVPETVGVRNAIAADQKTIEHLRGVFIDISSEEADIRREMVEVSAGRDPGAAYARRQEISDRLIDTKDSSKAAALYTELASKNIAMVPTLVVLTDPRWSDPDAAIAPDILEQYQSIYQRIIGGGGDPKANYADLDQARRHFAAYSQLVTEMHAAGVDILVGTDAANPYVAPGYSIHEEMVLLGEAGLSPAETLRGATSLAAAYLGAGDRIGQVTQGYEADLLLLDDNPLRDITNTSKINRVFLNGNAYTPQELSDMWANLRTSN